MAIKPPDLLNRIPSVADLLEKPPIRALVERWNRSVVAGGVKSFLDELGSDLRAPRRRGKSSVNSRSGRTSGPLRCIPAASCIGRGHQCDGPLVGFALDQPANGGSRLGSSIRNRPRVYGLAVGR